MGNDGRLCGEVSGIEETSLAEQGSGAKMDYTTHGSTLILTQTELNALDLMLKAGDRAGFYLTYESMTDSREALLQ